MSNVQHARVYIDTMACVGSGTCAMLDPQHFELVDGKARAADGAVEMTEDLEDAIFDCPVQAISRSLD